MTHSNSSLRTLLTLGGLGAVSLCLMACGGPSPDHSDRTDRERVTYDDGVTQGAPSRVEEQRNDLEEPTDVDPWELEGDDLVVVSSAMIGELGSYAFSDDEARGMASSYSGSSDDFTYLDLRTTMSGGQVAMVGITIDGPLDHPDLLEGKVFTWSDWGTGEVHVDALGCTGTEDMWEDFDAPADEVEITVTPDSNNPDNVIVEFVGSWTSYDGVETMDVKGAAKLDRGS